MKSGDTPEFDDSDRIQFAYIVHHNEKFYALSLDSESLQVTKVVNVGCPYYEFVSYMYSVKKLCKELFFIYQGAFLEEGDEGYDIQSNRTDYPFVCIYVFKLDIKGC